MTQPYYQDDWVTLYHGDWRETIAEDFRADLILTDPPYGETSLEPLITYACPPGGLVLDLFAGSCSTAVAARATGRRAVCFEVRESQCEAAAGRLNQGVLDFGGEAS